MSATSDSSKLLSTLQIGRGLAALGVVIFHACTAANAFVASPPGAASTILSVGSLGVDFFFVLSGFIIYYAHSDDLPGPTSAKRYALKRITRIFLPYLPISCAMMLAYTLAPSVSHAVRDWGVATSLFLVPSHHPTALSVAWTLIHEMMFYVLFLPFFISRRALFWTLGAWAAAILTARAMHFDSDVPVLKVALAAINLEFLFGLACVLLAKRVSQKAGPAIFAFGAAASLVAGYVVAVYDVPRVIFGLAIAPVVLGAVLMQDRLQKVPRSLLGLGDASYSIYLLHVPVIAVTARAYAAMATGWLGALVTMSLVAILAGLAYHRLIERPGLVAARSLIENRMTSRPRVD